MPLRMESAMIRFCRLLTFSVYSSLLIFITTLIPSAMLRFRG